MTDADRIIVLEGALGHAERENERLRKRCRTYRRALRQLNKAHEILWKVLNIRLTARRGEER